MRSVTNSCRRYCRKQRTSIKAIPLINALFSEVNPIPVKKAVSLMGMEAGGLRMPLTEMEEANAQKLAQAMRAFGIQLA